MKNILIIGAGRSSSALIQYLAEETKNNDWHLVVADRDEASASARIRGLDNCTAKTFDALNPELRRAALAEADIVISMLPARFHLEVVKDCLELKISIITPSYVTEEIKSFDEEAKKAGVFILNEMGLDPGIDHMSAMKIIHEIERKSGRVTLFKSFTGGLIAPESDTNPWNYKFTWNPRNVILAGQGGAAEYIRSGKYKFIPYHKLFTRTEEILIPPYGAFEGYANRNSLEYREVYGLEGIPTIYRGTLRRKGFAEAWNVFVQLGMTDDSYQIEESEHMTYRDFINSYLTYEEVDSVEKKVCDYLDLDAEGEIMQKLVWSGIFEQEKIGLKNATPAQILQKRLESKWSLEEGDKDMIAMYHFFEYELDGEKKKLSSSMVSIGHDQIYTGMARTVGLPIAISVKLILSGQISLSGVHLPTIPEIYEPILAELDSLGIHFIEQEVQ